jgi:hypothetical protein
MGDAAIPAPSSIEYYQNVRAFSRHTRTRARRVLRRPKISTGCFLCPELGHCGGGAGANSFGNGGSGAASGRDPDRDIFSALERGAFVDTLLRGRKADAAIAARNERDFSVKLAHLFLLDVWFFRPLTSTV